MPFANEICPCNLSKKLENQVKENERLRKELRKVKDELEESKIQVKALSQYIANQAEDTTWDI